MKLIPHQLQLKQKSTEGQQDLQPFLQVSYTLKMVTCHHHVTSRDIMSRHVIIVMSRDIILMSYHNHIASWSLHDNVVVMSHHMS